MFKRIRDTLRHKQVEHELAEDEESRFPLREPQNRTPIVSPIETKTDSGDDEVGDDDEAGPARLQGLTNVKKFGQLLGSIVLDCSPHQLPRSATTHPVHWAVRESNNAVLVKLLENEKWRWNLEAFSSGELPLHVAAEVDNVEGFKILIEHGANPHARQLEYYGKSSVQVAASKGSIKVLKYLTNELVSYGSQDFITAMDLEGATALHWAVLGGEVACVRHLLERGAAVDWSQPKGPKLTPLHIGCIESSLEMVKLMAEIRPEEFRKALLKTDIQGCTPLHRAVVLDNVQLAEFLLDKGAAMNAEDSQGRTPIILAAVREAWQTTDLLIKWGVNPFQCNRKDLRHVGHHAAMVGADPRPCQGFQEGFAEHPEWKQKLDAVDSFGYNSLQYAAGYGHLPAFHGLLAIGASITARSEKSKTVLHYASKYGQLEMVKTLLALPAGISVLNAMDHKGRSALHLASSYGHHEVAELLLSKGAFCFRDDSGKTAFHNAAAKNHHHIMGTIATYFSLVLDAADKDGSTALHLAAANDAAESVQYLLAIDAAVKEDAFGRTPMDLAISHKNERAALAFVNSTHWREIVMQPSREYGSVVLGLVAHLPEVMKKCLDRCLEKSENIRPGESYITYDFSILYPTEPSEKTHYRHYVPMRALKVMASLGRSELLAHPVCTTLLERKWITYGMYCSGLVMASNLVFVALLSYVMMSAVRTDLRPHLLQKSYRNVEFHSAQSLINNTAFADLYERAFNHGIPSFQDSPSLVILGVALIIIFFKELAELRSEGYRYFFEWMNWMEMLLFLTCGGFVFCFYQDDREKVIGPYTYQLGAVAIFLAWFNLLRFCRPFGTFGIYSFMFFCTFKTLIQVSFFFFLLTAAFTATFSTIFQSLIFPNQTEYYQRHTDLDPEKLRTAHESVTNSALRIGAMTIGDLESLENFIYPLMDGMLEYPLLSFIFYSVFLMLMPILLNNLLTGLAIGDMAVIQANAASLRLEMQVYLHESMEKLFPSKLLKKFERDNKQYRVYPGVRPDIRTVIARWLQSGGIRQPIITGGLSEVEEHEILSRATEKENLGKMHRKLKHLDAAFSEQRHLLAQVITRLDRMFPIDETDQIAVFASSITEKARKRNERTEEDRRQAARLDITKRRIVNNNSAGF